MKYVLILGAGSDIARPLAFLYAKHGYNIYLASRSYDQLVRDAHDISLRFKVDAQAFKFDAADVASHQSFYDSLPYKPIGVITLAGALGDQKQSEQKFTDAKNVIDVNYTGLVSIIHIIAADFEQRREGFIVGVSSVAGERGRKSNYVYASAKAGFTTFLSGLRNRLHSAGVQVMTVHPGFVRTKMIEGRTTPGIITASAEDVARDIFKAQQLGKDFVYSKWFWRFIMMAFTMIPESIAKKLDLK
ncbi:MAG: SDR family oxidoreductase [Ignavibacteriales bacterium]|nr:SDR family oxidoreductase [Ignavibacteriales bacterium]